MPWPRSSRARGPRSPAMATPRRTSTPSSASSASPPPSRRHPAANRQVPSRASPCPTRAGGIRQGHPCDSGAACTATVSDTTTPRAHHPAKCPKCAHPVLIYSDATTLILSVRQHRSPTCELQAPPYYFGSNVCALAGVVDHALDAKGAVFLEVIFGGRVSRGRDLRRPVVDSVADETLAARSRLFHPCGSLPDRVPCRPLVAECAGELAAEPGVLVGKLLVAVEGGGEPGAQRRVGGPLARGDGGGADPVCLGSQSADLAADVGLGVKPRPGDPGFSELGSYVLNCHVRAYLCPPASLMAVMTRQRLAWSSPVME